MIYICIYMLEAVSEYESLSLALSVCLSVSLSLSPLSVCLSISLLLTYTISFLLSLISQISKRENVNCFLSSVGAQFTLIFFMSMQLNSNFLSV